MSHSDGSTPTAARGVRMARPARRAQLLGAAREVFVERGYHAAGMDEIATRAGVSKPVLYQHFPGKMELYLGLLDDANDQVVAIVLNALENATTNKERVFATIEAYFDFVARKDASYRLVFESDLSNDPVVRSRADRVQERCTVEVARFLGAGTELPADEALLLAVGVVGAAQTSARHWVEQGQRVPQHDAARLVAAMAWRGVRAFPQVEGEQTSEQAG